MMAPETRPPEGDDRETIFAPATGPGVAGIAVIRISGTNADAVLSRLTGRPLPPPRQAALRGLRDETGDLIDQAIVLRFAAGSSFTGEATAELHCHGGRAVVFAILGYLGRQPGCRLAEPGEFTRRAFEAGRLDLAEIEALGDLLAAETELQRRQAARGLSGALHRQAETWRADLIRAAALVEATIDWADEEVPEKVGPEVAGLIAGVQRGISRELSLSDGAERLRVGYEVAIMGAPNAGKSSLFNALAGREAAITSVLPGTTRDVLELRYDLAGLPVIFLDTAGLRATDDEIEAIGVGRAKDRAQAAALRLFLYSADAPPAAAEALLWQPGDLRVRAKADLEAGPGSGPGPGDLAISALRGDGISSLLDCIKAELSRHAVGDGLVGHLRQRKALEVAIGALARAENALETGEAEMIADDLRVAFRALEGLTGRVGADDILDAVFAAFCLGK
jgi:tRNA modification GTPase